DRHRLVHKAAVRAIQREPLAPKGPIVRLARATAVWQGIVGAVANEPLAGAAGVTRDGDLLVILGECEAAEVRPQPRAGVRPPRPSRPCPAPPARGPSLAVRAARARARRTSGLSLSTPSMVIEEPL